MSTAKKDRPVPFWLLQAADRVAPALVTTALRAIRDDSCKTWPVSADDPLQFVTVGHWNCGNVYRRAKGNRTERAVMSRCGIVEFYADWEIVSGRLPKTCLACRGGTPSPTRVVYEPASYQFYWEDPVANVISPKVEEKSNLKGREAVQEWHDFGYDVVLDVLRRSTLGAEFGWKSLVRDCHDEAVKKGRPTTVRVQRIEESQKFLTLVIHPRDSVYTFEVDLRTVRTDVPFRDVAKAVADAVAGLAAPEPPPKPEPAPELPPPPARPPSPGAPIDLEQLTRMRSNLDKLLQVGGDMNECAEMRARTEARIVELRTQDETIQARLTEARTAREQATTATSVAKTRADEYERKYRNAQADYQAAAEAEAAATHAVAGIETEHGPIAAELGRLTTELAEIEQLEADRLKSIGQAKDLIPLLQALRQLGSS